MEKILNKKRVDKQTAIVVSISKAIAPEFVRTTNISSMSRLPTCQFTGLKEHDLTGIKVDRLEIIGHYLYANRTYNSHKSKWVVKCSCGRYQVKAGKTLRKAIASGQNIMCYICKINQDRKQKTNE